MINIFEIFRFFYPIIFYVVGDASRTRGGTAGKNLSSKNNSSSYTSGGWTVSQNSSGGYNVSGNGTSISTDSKGNITSSSNNNSNNNSNSYTSGGYTVTTNNKGGYDVSGGGTSYSTDNTGNFTSSKTNSNNSIIDNIKGWFSSPDDISTTTITNQNTISIYTQNYTTNETISQLGTLRSDGSYSWGVDVTKTDTFGYSSNSYYGSIGGVAQTSYHTDNIGSIFESSYDQHYFSLTNQEYGFFAEAYADVKEFIGGEQYESTAKHFEAFGTVLTIGLVGLPSLASGMAITQAGISLKDSAIVSLGAISTFASTSYITNELNNLSSIYGAEPSFTLAITNESFGSEDDIKILTKTLDDEIESIAKARREYLSDVATMNIFNKMAGGYLYDGVMAGGDYFDASTVHDMTLSVGGDYSMSEFAQQLYFPYTNSEIKNQAGSDTFTVLYQI